jgi:hypothetical protein
MIQRRNAIQSNAHTPADSTNAPTTRTTNQIVDVRS